MKLIDAIPYRVAALYACALINDDESGFDEEDDKLMAAFLKAEGGPWTVPTDEYGEYAPTEFVRCEVSNKMADCMLVEKLIYAPDTP